MHEAVQTGADTNAERAAESRKSAATLRVTEIYRSIQGESTWAGLTCTFVRLARCHIRCAWCDTAYAFRGGDTMTIPEIVEHCKSLDSNLVEVTGGEPLVQAGCIELVETLINAGFRVLVETSGTLPIDALPPESICIMDLKCPDSGVSEHNCWSNVDALRPHDEVKFVIASRRDYEWARGVTRDYALPKRCNAVLFSPAFGLVDPAALVDWILEDALDVRFQVQTHKVVWDPNARGV